MMEQEDTICLQCGDAGCTNAFVYCVKCLNFAVHRYCLDVMPQTVNEFVRWFCDDCADKVKSQIPSPGPGCNNTLKYTSTALVVYKTENDELVCKDVGEQPYDDCVKLPFVEFGKSANQSSLVQSERNNDAKNSVFQQPEKENVDSKSQKRQVKKKPKMRKLDRIECANQHKHRKKLSIRCVDGDLNVSPRSATDSTVPSKVEHKKGSHQPSDSHSRLLKHPVISADIKEDVSFAKPVIMPSWRGSISILNEKFDNLDELVAHPSCKACIKVYEAAAKFAPTLQFELLPKSEIWPKSFQKAKPSDENIALYFFPSKISERNFDVLVEKMMNEELGLKAVVQNAELLVFNSTELPLRYWRFQGKYYIWGVFRSRQEAASELATCVRMGPPSCGSRV